MTDTEFNMTNTYVQLLKVGYSLLYSPLSDATRRPGVFQHDQEEEEEDACTFLRSNITYFLACKDFFIRIGLGIRASIMAENSKEGLLLLEIFGNRHTSF